MIKSDVKLRWIYILSYVRRFVVLHIMTNLQAEMASECSRATAVAAHDVSWMLWNTCMFFMLSYAVMFMSSVIFRVQVKRGDRNHKAIDCRLTLLHRA